MSRLAWGNPCPCDALARPTKLKVQKGGLRLGSLEDSVPFRCLGPYDQIDGALRPWWPIDKGNASSMKFGYSAKMGTLQCTVASPPPTCGRQSKSSSDLEKDLWCRTSNRGKLVSRGSRLSTKLLIARLASMAGGTGASGCFLSKKLVNGVLLEVWE
jgi:hypothetical protein